MSAPKSIKYGGQVYRLAEAEVKTAAFEDANQEALALLSSLKHKADHIKSKDLPMLNMWLGHLTEALFPSHRSREVPEADVRALHEAALSMALASQHLAEAFLKVKTLTHEVGRATLPEEARLPVGASVRQADMYTPTKGEDVTPQVLMNAFPGDIDEQQAHELASLAYKGGRKDTFLNAVNQAIGGHGIEAQANPLQYSDEPIALYVNTGDLYNATVLYDIEANRLYVTTLGDWRDAWEQEHAGIYGA